MPERGHGLATGRRRLMPAAGADAAAGKAAAARTLAFAASTIGYHQRHPLHGKKRFSNSHNENARTEVDARNRYGRFPATYCGRAAWRTRPQPTSADDVPRCGDTAARGTNERRRCVRLAADLRVRRYESPEIERSDSPTRVRAPRSVSDESASTVLAALAGVGLSTTRVYCDRARAE
jgi:hypothetical protein